MVVAACCFCIVAIAIIMAMNSRGEVPWGNRMRRIHAGVASKAEWMAPDEVVQQVTANYLTAVRWLHDQMLSASVQQMNAAPIYLSGAYLKRFATVVSSYRNKGLPRFLGVLRADHTVTVRSFSEDGERCLVVDQQAQRRMATYASRSHERIGTQDLGDGAVVYKMVYDRVDNRWKIDEFVQELPSGWGQRKAARHLRELALMPSTIGRDN